MFDSVLNAPMRIVLLDWFLCNKDLRHEKVKEATKL